MLKNFIRFVVDINDDTDEAQPMAASALNTANYAYVDKRALEEIERAVLAAGNDDEDKT
jgi:hypothetical protein